MEEHSKEIAFYEAHLKEPRLAEFHESFKEKLEGLRANPPVDNSLDDGKAHLLEIQRCNDRIRSQEAAIVEQKQAVEVRTQELEKCREELRNKEEKLEREKESLETHLAKANGMFGQGKRPTGFNLEMLYIEGESEADTRTRLEAMYQEIRQLEGRKRAMDIDSQTGNEGADARAEAEHRAEEVARSGAEASAFLVGGGGPPPDGDGGNFAHGGGGAHTPQGGAKDGDSEDGKSPRRSRSPANRKSGEDQKSRPSKGKGAATE